MKVRASATQRVAAISTHRAVIENLLDRSFSLRHADPTKMLGLASQAVLQSAADLGPPESAAELRSRAHSHLGNALRIAGQLDRAEIAFRSAERELALAGDRRLASALLAEFRSGLHDARREPLAALRCLKVAAYHYRELGADGRVQMMLRAGLILRFAGEPASAIPLLSKALSEATDAATVAAAMQITASALVDIGMPDVAQDILLQLRQASHLTATLGTLAERRLRWVEARAAAGIGAFRFARQTLEACAEEFAADELVREATLATIDGAAVEALSGNILGAHRFCKQAESLARGAGLAREGFALRILRASLRSAGAHPKLLGEVSCRAEMMIRRT